MNDIKQTAMITIVGRPNVGKSTLTNALVGEKIAIVSSKPQTTRNRICGVVNRGDTQFVLLDTPGFHRARTRLGDYMVKVVRESVADVDGVCLLVEPIAKVGAPEQALIDRIREEQLPAVLVINKIDTVEKPQLLEVMAAYSAACAFDAIIPISAQEKDGLDVLMEQLAKYAAPGPQLFPDGMTTDQPERQGIIIGKSGAMLKKIASHAREDIERFMGAKVYMETWVKVKENWRDNLNYVRSFGYDEQ